MKDGSSQESFASEFISQTRGFSPACESSSTYGAPVPTSSSMVTISSLPLDKIDGVGPDAYALLLPVMNQSSMRTSTSACAAPTSAMGMGTAGHSGTRQLWVVQTQTWR